MKACVEKQEQEIKGIIHFHDNTALNDNLLVDGKSIRACIADMFGVDDFRLQEYPRGFTDCSLTYYEVEIFDPRENQEWYNGYYKDRKNDFINTANQCKEQAATNGERACLTLEFLENDIIFSMLCEAGYLEPGYYLMRCWW